MSPQDVVRQAVDMLTSQAREPSRSTQENASVTPGNLPKGFVSRHPDRDYSWFGSLKGEFGDGVAYQEQVRSQW